ncbi:MAG: tetratricopeptide repeat protein [Nannocystaceae bacterium]
MIVRWQRRAPRGALTRATVAAVWIAALGLAGCTSALDEPESVAPGEVVVDEELAPTPWPAVKLAPLDRRAPPPALPGTGVERDEAPPTIVRYSVAPADVGVLPQRGLVALYAEVDGAWRAVGVGEPLDAGGLVAPIWLDVRRYGGPLEARPMTPGVPGGAAVAQVTAAGEVVRVSVGRAEGARVGDLYETVADAAGDPQAILKITAVDEGSARASVVSGELRAGAWARQLRRLPVASPAWIEGVPLDVGARRWLASLLVKEGVDGALRELRRRVALGVAEDRLLLIAALTAYGRWGEADALVGDALAAARDAGDRPAELAAQLVGARLDLELGDGDGAADRLAQARELGPSGAAAAAHARLEAELRYLRWDLLGAASILEERALPALAGLGEPQDEAAAHAMIATIERHRGAFDRAAARMKEQVLSRLEAAEDRAQRARALDLLADVEIMRGPPGPAIALRREQELPIYAALDDPWGEARAQRRLADYETSRGHNRAAKAAYEAATRAVARSGDRHEELRLRRWYADFIFTQSDFRGSLERVAAIVEDYARLGDPRAYAVHLAARAELAALLGDLGESLRIIKREALPLATALGDEYARLSVRASLASLYVERGMLREALKIRRDELLPSYKRLADPREEAFTYVLLADSLSELGEVDEAERGILSKAVPVLKALGEVRLGALCLDRLGGIQHIRGDFDAVARLREEERAIYARIGDRLGAALVEQRRGRQLSLQGRYDEAIAVLEREVLPELRRIGAIGYTGAVATDLGVAYTQLGDFTKARAVYNEMALPAYEQLGDRRGAANVHALLGDLHYAQGEYAAALELYRELVLPAYTTAGDVIGRAMTLTRIADCEFVRGELTAALKLLREAQGIYESVGDTYSLALTFASIAGVYEAQGKYNPALELYRDRVLPAYARSGDAIAVAVAKSRMADLHFQLGDVDQAIAIREVENEVFRKAGAEYALMGSRWMLAVYLDRRAKVGDRERARTLAEQALGVAIRLRVPEEAQIRDFIQRMKR